MSKYGPNWIRTNRLNVVIAAAIAAMFLMVGAPQSFLGNPQSAAAASPASSGNSLSTATPARTTLGPLVEMGPASKGAQNGTMPGSPTYSIISSTAAQPQQISVMVTLSPNSDMNSLLSEVQQPGSPVYDHFLTDSQIGQLFGPSVSTLQTVETYFQSYGLSVTAAPDGLSLSIHGPTTDVEAAFHTSIGMFKIEYKSNGQWNAEFGPGSVVNGSVSTLPYYANTEPFSLPSSIASVVSGVVGLDAARATPDISLPAGLAPDLKSPQNNVPLVGSPCSKFPYGVCDTQKEAFNDSYGNFTWAGTNSTDTLCASFGICGYGDYQFLMPQTMPAVVGAHALWNGSSAYDGKKDTGQNVTLAVVEVGCIQPTTLFNFSEQLWGNGNQLTSRFTQIALPGSQGNQSTLSECIYNSTINGWGGETALDIEYAAAMAPGAHIDLIAAPDAAFESFDQAYQFIINYLSADEPCPSSFGDNGTFVGIANDSGACSVSIDSNSYGSGEAYTAFIGAPIYLTVENQLLSELSLEGVTNFFASGDYSAGGAAWGMVQAGMPAIATGSVAVGGGQLTAMAPNGRPFQNTSKFVPLCLEWSGSGCLENMTVNVTSAVGIYSYSPWAAYCDYGPIYCGYVGGGHGPSETLATPWWENANDTYTSGVKVDPAISNAAAFNMTIYVPNGYGIYGTEGWYPLYGGTSFATPITAGEWALVEEQAAAEGGVSHFGDIDGLLFELHNANQADVPYAKNLTFDPMGFVPEGFTTADWDSFNAYLYNLSIVQSPATNLPPWSFSAQNPAGPDWDFLGGLGVLLPTVASNEIVGLSKTSQSVVNAGMSIVEDVGAKTVAVTELPAGTSYKFSVTNKTTGLPIPDVDVWAYSGGPNNGTYGGGATTFINSTTGTFTYTPRYTFGGIAGNLTEYAFFKAVQWAHSAPKQWAFNAYATLPSRSNGTLTLAVNTPNGDVTSGAAEITSFTEFDMSGWYTFGSTAQVLLNGQPEAGATVVQQSVSWNWSSNPESYGSTLPPGDWAPGSLVSDWISDTNGQVTYFTNGLTAEGNPYTDSWVIPPQVFELWAVYGGMTSAPVTVFVEPQSGLFEPQLSVNTAATTITGNVSFSDMKYLTYLNVSYGSAPGQYENWSCANDAAFCPTTSAPPESSLFSGTLPVSLSLATARAPPGYILVNMTASGNNTLYTSPTQPYWAYYVNLTDKGPKPTVSLTSTPGPGVVSGTVGLSYGAVWKLGSTKLKGATATLTEEWPGNSTVLASGTLLVNNGTLIYPWNTNATPAGYVGVSLVVTTPSGLMSNTTSYYYVAKPLITVLPGPLYAGENATFNAWSEGGTKVTYAWSFGDGSTSTLAEPMHAYASAGSYSVNVWVNNSAGLAVPETTTVTVMAAVPPVVTASANPAYVGQLVDFSATVPGGAPAAPLTYAWSFGDGTSSKLVAPSHVFTKIGTYTVLVWENASTGGGIAGSLSLSVTAAPSAIITASANPALVGETVWFSASVPSGAPPDPLTYVWSFGDGASSILETPSHVYTKAGTYAVSVWENGSSGVGPEGSFTITVTAPTIPTIVVSQSPTDAGVPVSFSLTQPAGSPAAPPTYKWHFGDGQTSTEAAPEHVYTTAGTYTVTAWENGTSGLNATSTTQVTVNSDPSVAISFSTSSPQVGQSVTITATVTGGTGTDTIKYIAPSGLGCPSNATGSSVQCTPSVSGQLSITVVVSDSTNTQSVAVATVTVSTAPSSNIFSSSGSWTGPLAIALAAIAAILLLLFLMERKKRNKTSAPPQPQAAGQTRWEAQPAPGAWPPPSSPPPPPTTPPAPPPTTNWP